MKFRTGLITAVLLLFSTCVFAQSAAEVETAKSVARSMGYTDAEINTMLNNYVNGNQSSAKGQQSAQAEGRQNAGDAGSTAEATDEGAGQNEILEQAGAAAGAIYGHSVFARGGSWTPGYNIPTPDKYVLGPGDEIVIDMWGAVFRNIVKTISSEGSVVLDDIGPVYLNGLTVTEAEKVLKQQLSKVNSGLAGDNPDTFMQLSLGKVRSVTVSVFGDVNVPGSYTLPALSTMLSAVNMAGGVTDIGTVRNIKLYRGGKVIREFDLYRYFGTEDYGRETRLQENDVIIVESYDNVVEINGEVKRPMRYEMKDGETLADLIDFAGGLTARASRTTVHVERTSMSPVLSFEVPYEALGGFVLEGGDVVTVKLNRDLQANTLSIGGAVWNPGTYALSDNIRTASQLIESAGGLLSSAYKDRALFIRVDPVTNRPLMQDLSIDKVLSGEDDPELMNGDAIYVYSYDELLPVYYVNIMGEVKQPGEYPFGKDMTIADAILMAGGTTEYATLANVEIARRVQSRDGLTAPDSIAMILNYNLIENPDNMAVKLQPYDMVFVRRIPGYKSQIVVTVNGEVNFPGSHVIEKKQVRLSDVIAKTGGFTQEAYLYGARLSRALTQEEVDRANKAREIALSKLSAEDEGMDIQIAQVTVDDRYNVVIDLAAAIENPGSDADIVLRSGDIISVPQIDYSVKVSGGVQFPNVLSYKNGLKLKDYISMAGGYVQRAKKNHVYVVHMNGEVQSRRGTSAIHIRPGAEIVVPVKETRREVSAAEVMSIATSTASLATMVVSMVTLLSK